MASLNNLAEVVRQTRASALKDFGHVTAHPDEVRQIPSREGGRPIRIHVYKPSKQDSPAPVLINFHGSGFLIPLHGSDDEFAHLISKKTNCIVLDCAYRLAPENPWPAAVHDAEDVVKWVLAHPEEFSSSHISISGFSAGGSLSLIVSSQLFPHGTFQNVIAVYPATNLDQSAASKTAPDMTRIFLPAELMDLFTNCYLPNPDDRKNALASPFFTPVDKFADRMLIATGACDLLCPEAEDLAYNIRDKTNKHVEVYRYDGCEHAWDKTYEKGSTQEKAKDELYDRIVSFLSS